MGLNFQELRFSHGGMAWSAGLLQRSWKFIRWSYGFLRNWEFFKWGVWGFFIMVEAILGWLKLLRGVIFFSFSCRLTFFQKVKVSHGIKILPVTWVSCQDVRDFSGGGWGVNFFSGGNSGFFLGGGRIHLKISILSWRSFIMHTPKRTKL